MSAYSIYTIISLMGANRTFSIPSIKPTKTMKPKEFDKTTETTEATGGIEGTEGIEGIETTEPIKHIEHKELKKKSETVVRSLRSQTLALKFCQTKYDDLKAAQTIADKFTFATAVRMESTLLSMTQSHLACVLVNFGVDRNVIKHILVSKSSRVKLIKELQRPEGSRRRKGGSRQLRDTALSPTWHLLSSLNIRDNASIESLDRSKRLALVRALASVRYGHEAIN